MSAPADKLVVSSVEVNLTEHCNLKCAGCDHASPHLPERFASVEAFRADLAALAPHLRATEVRFVGGEPLLHEGLLDFVKVAKASGVAEYITLITNGVLLHQMSPELWDLVDIIWVSIYPGVKRKIEVELIETLAARHHTVIWKRDSPEFYLTLVNRRIDDDAAVRSIFASCQKKTTCNTIHEGRFYLCAPSVFVGKRLALRGDVFDNRADGVPLHDNPDLAAQLASHLRREEPLLACRHCLVEAGPLVPSRQLNRDARREELAADDSAIVAAVTARLRAEAGGAPR